MTTQNSTRESIKRNAGDARDRRFCHLLLNNVIRIGGCRGAVRQAGRTNRHGRRAYSKGNLCTKLSIGFENARHGSLPTPEGGAFFFGGVQGGLVVGQAEGIDLARGRRQITVIDRNNEAHPKSGSYRGTTVICGWQLACG